MYIRIGGSKKNYGAQPEKGFENMTFAYVIYGWPFVFQSFALFYSPGVWGWKVMNIGKSCALWDLESCLKYFWIGLLI